MEWPHIFTFFCTCLARLLFGYAARIDVLGREHLPSSGAFLLASNHISHFDPPLLSILLPRRVEWLTMRELFQHPLSSQFFRWIGAIPVDRQGKDRTALRASLRRLQQGAVVGIFPEGGIRSDTRSLLQGAPPKLGVSALATLAQVPVIPCVVLGTDRLYMPQYWNPWKKILGGRAPLWVAFGNPIEPRRSLASAPQRADVQERLCQAFQNLTQDLVEHYKLCPEDLPKTAQERRAEI